MASSHLAGAALPSFRRRVGRGIAYYISIGVGLEKPLACINQHEAVPPRIGNNDTLSHWNFKRAGHNRAAGGREALCCVRCRVDEQVGFLRAIRGMKDQLGIAVGETESCSVRGSPNQRLAECVAVERERGIQVRHSQTVAVDLSEEWIAHRSLLLQPTPWRDDYAPVRSNALILIGLQSALPVSHIDPAIELEAHLFEVSDLLETPLLMKRYARLIRQGNRADNSVDASIFQDRE